MSVAGRLGTQRKLTAIAPIARHEQTVPSNSPTARFTFSPWSTSLRDIIMARAGIDELPCSFWVWQRLEDSCDLLDLILESLDIFVNELQTEQQHLGHDSPWHLGSPQMGKGTVTGTAAPGSQMGEEEASPPQPRLRQTMGASEGGKLCAAVIPGPKLRREC